MRNLCAGLLRTWGFREGRYRFMDLAGPGGRRLPPDFFFWLRKNMLLPRVKIFFCPHFRKFSIFFAKSALAWNAIIFDPQGAISGTRRPRSLPGMPAIDAETDSRHFHFFHAGMKISWIMRTEKFKKVDRCRKHNSSRVKFSRIYEFGNLVNKSISGFREILRKAGNQLWGRFS